MEDIRQTIINLAAHKMRKVGIKSISIDDICRELGMSKKTFYVYFETKDDLIRDLLAKHEQEIEASIRAKARGRSILNMLMDFINIASRTKDVRKDPPLLYDLQKYYPQLFAEHLEHIRHIAKQLMEQFLQQGVDEGIFRSDLDVEKTAAILSFLHHEMMNLSPQIRENHKSAVIAHTKYGVDIFMRGIISEEGARMVREMLVEK